MNILGICGSIRKGSSNWAILKAFQKHFIKHEWHLVDLTTLPYFDPDLQFGPHVPGLVLDLREKASQSDLIVVSSPEYAHGIPGILKNGLEWLFWEGTMKKPVVLLIGAGGGEFVRDQLLEVLKTMDFEVHLDRTLLIKGPRSKITAEGVFLDQKDQLVFEHFCQALSI